MPDGTVKDGPETVVRCFMATLETRPAVGKAAWHNMGILRGWGRNNRNLMSEILYADVPDVDIIRIHGGGDFYSREYMGAWADVAGRLPGKLFYAYTKSIPYWLDLRDEIPPNLMLTASEGGKFDHLIADWMRRAVIVLYEHEAEAMGLEIDHDDTHPRDPDCGKFALLIHGTQPAGSEGGKAVASRRMKGENTGGE